MKISINKIIVLYIILIGVSFANTMQDFTSPISSTKTSIVNQKDEFISYLSDVLVNAGFSDETRKYLVENAQKQITAIRSIDKKEKMRLLKRNLYIFLKNMSEKYQTSTSSDVIRKEYFKAEQYPQPWDYILSKDVLHIFKSNHLFDRLTVEDINNLNLKFCAIWPFCPDD